MPGNKIEAVVILLENVIVPGMFVLLNWPTVVVKTVSERFVPYVIVDDGRWLNKNDGVNFTFIVIVDELGKYKSVFVGVKLQNIVNGPRALNVDAIDNISPVLLFFLKMYVPSTPALVPVIKDSIVV